MVEQSTAPAARVVQALPDDAENLKRLVRDLFAERDLAWPAKALDTARATLEKQGDRVNAAHARHLEVRRLLLMGHLDEAERALAGTSGLCSFAHPGCKAITPGAPKGYVLQDPERKLTAPGAGASAVAELIHHGATLGTPVPFGSRVRVL